jgi:hypothetical protein
MRILSLSENVQAVVDTAALLNDPPPEGYTYRLPVLGMGLTSLHGYNRDAILVFRGYLRELVQEWMRCGRRIMPKNAAVHAAGMGPDEHYSTKWHWSMSLFPRHYDEFGRFGESKELDTSDPAYTSWLWRVYWDYLHREKPNIWFNSDGEVLFNYTTPVYGHSEPFVELPPFLNADSPSLNCWREAVLWFILLLNSGHAQLLDRCVFCERYFVRRREVKSGQSYKRGGPNCGECRAEGSKARTSDIRAKAKSRMLDVAAEAWATWKKCNRTPDKYSAVESQVNSKCSAEIFITTRKHRIETVWVKRNEREIVARIAQIQLRKEQDQNAKG